MLVTATENDVLHCYHCGETCAGDHIRSEEKVFCCDGCKVVYDLLETNNLCTYYSLTDKPGVSIKNPESAARYAFLDDETVQAQLLSFRNGSISKITFYIPQMHCSSCIWLLENLHKLDEGVVEARVNFLRKEAAITYRHGETTLKNVVTLLAHIGYEPEISLDNQSGRVRKKDKTIFIRLGLAGFCFANVMLLSFPDYLDSTGQLQKDFGIFFSYLNILLSIPVLLYSARGFFTSALSGLKQRVINLDVPISLGLASLFAVSLGEILLDLGPGYLDSFTGLVFFMLIGKYFQQITYDSLSFDRDYKSYFPISVTFLKNGSETVKAVKDLKIGDRIRIRNQELVPADSILMRGKARIDYSFVSGESEPVEKVAGEVIYAGGRQVGESIELEVVKEVSQGYLTQLWNNDVFRKSSVKTFTSYTNVVGKGFIFVTLILALGSLWYWVPRDTNIAVKAFTSVLIIACPCALSLSVPFTLGHTMRFFGKNKLYLKNNEVVAALAQADTVVFDKTGTLTQTSRSELVYEGEPLSAADAQQLRSVLKHSTHPLSLRVYDALEGQALPVKNFQEITGKGISGLVCDVEIRIGSAAFTGAQAGPDSATVKQTRVYVSLNGNVKGCYSLRNVYREGLVELLAELKGLNKKLAVLSGDNDTERERLQELFGPEAELHFNQSPVSKLEYIKKLKAEGRKVVMVGDGLNDAGALRQSDAGIALTDNVTGFSPSCDAILDAGQFRRLPVFMKFSKTALKIILASFCVSFVYNIIGLTLAVMGKFSPVISAILMPISSLSVIGFATASVMVAARKYVLNKEPETVVS